MDNIIEINKYLYFDCEDGAFRLTDEAQNILYREKEVICSYSGCDDWCNHFIHEMMNLYTGSSPYNYALGTCDHHNQFNDMWNSGHKVEVIDWVRRSVNKQWGIHMYQMIVNIIDDVPKIE